MKEGRGSEGGGRASPARAIASRELGSYLRSPTGWVVAAAVLLLGGLLFYAQALGPDAGARLSGEVLGAFFYSTSGLTAVAAVALSVRLVAEERVTGTQVLLDTSPIPESAIVLGKFAAAWAFLAGILLVALYMPLLVLVNGRVSTGHVAVGHLGLLLLGGAGIAIGLFASSLTRRPLLAAALGAAITAALFLFWPLSFATSPPLSRALAGLALHGRHFASFQAGILHLRDVVYYLAVIAFFLISATKVLQARRWR